MVEVFCLVSLFYNNLALHVLPDTERDSNRESHGVVAGKGLTHINITIKYKISHTFHHLVFETHFNIIQLHLFPTIDMCPHFDYNIIIAMSYVYSFTHLLYNAIIYN